ncbi:hypothetical protein CHS0354_006678 [Potamilus streckersoni]|uniref:Peptidase S1 domain-containing protein n=1 Tax=Potamilus streckersoni TaxID=2493646 RepID=A0AAE0SXS1_9BIVA|nr:hypothetical protein CHS0354_006678 [Potamilus streckersoni]
MFADNESLGSSILLSPDKETKVPSRRCEVRVTDMGGLLHFTEGDSGGPMVCNGLLAGVASWTIKGCGANDPSGTFPSVYVRVSHYIDWIMNTIRANNFV